MIVLIVAEGEQHNNIGEKPTVILYYCVSVFSSHIFWTSGLLDVPARLHRRKVAHDLSSTFCGAYLNFSREKDPGVPFPHRP